MHRFNFVKMMDEHMVRSRVPSYRKDHLYPSEASVVDVNGNVYGQCLRAVWYRLNKTEPTNPPNARSMYIFRFGEMVEQMVINNAKEMGVWVDDHVKWYDENLHISGELDIVLRNPEEPDQLFLAEVKSFYGFMAHKQIMGNFHTTGFPKMDQLLQAFTYVDHYKDVFAGCKMIYVARDNLSRKEFNVEWDYYPDANGSIIVHPSIDGKGFTDFSMQGINERFRLAWGFYEHNELPPRDYKLYYSIEEMEAMVAAEWDIKDSAGTKKRKIELVKKVQGDPLICKTNAEGFLNNRNNFKFRKAGWRCSYCDYKNLCWAEELRNMDNADQKIFMIPEEGLEDAA